MSQVASSQTRRHRWLRRLGVGLATLIGVSLASSLVIYRMLRAQPDWYRPAAMSVQDRDAAANRAEGKLRSIQNQAARAHAAEVARNNSTQPLKNSSSRTMIISFTDSELNAFFDKWAVLNHWKSSYQSYMDDPAIVLREGRLILAARVKELDTVASLHFEPKLDEQGRLDMQLVRVFGGRMPLPLAALGGPMRKLADQIQQHLPAWQNNAIIDANGSANNGAIYATMGGLLIDTLTRQPAEPVLFLPVLGNGSMAVKLTDVRIADNTLTLTVEPLDPNERTAVLNRIKHHRPGNNE